MTHIFQPFSNVVVPLAAILLFYLCRPALVLAVIHRFRRPTSAGWSQCGVCGLNEVCDTCGDCHYCNDISLPCKAMSRRHSTTLTLISAQASPSANCGREDEEDAPIRLQTAAGDQGNGGNNNNPPYISSYPDDYHPEFNRCQREVQRIQQRVSRLMASIFHLSSSRQPYQHVVSPPLPPTITQDAADHLDSTIIGSVIPTPSCGIHWEPVDGGLQDHPAYQHYLEIQDNEQTNGEQDDDKAQIQIVARTFQGVHPQA